MAQPPSSRLVQIRGTVRYAQPAGNVSTVVHNAVARAVSTLRRGEKRPARMPHRLCTSHP
jgi:hypothetical protein